MSIIDRRCWHFWINMVFSLGLLLCFSVQVENTFCQLNDTICSWPRKNTKIQIFARAQNSGSRVGTYSKLTTQGWQCKGVSLNGVPGSAHSSTNWHHLLGLESHWKNVTEKMIFGGFSENLIFDERLNIYKRNGASGKRFSSSEDCRFRDPERGRTASRPETRNSQ